MSTKPAVVMVVEDEVVLQDVYKLVLEAKGFTVHTASNGKEALEQAQVVSPDVILLDVHMPIMDGREFMRTIKLEDFPKTSIFVYSNLSDSAVEAEMLDLGAKQFVLKSNMTPEDLVSLVEQG